MDQEIISFIDESLQITYQLEGTMKWDSEEMEECVKGQVLTEYQKAMEQAISLLLRMRRQLQLMRDEQTTIP